MSTAKIFFFLCLSFIAGVFADSFVFLTQPLMLSIFILAVLLIAVFWRRKKLAAIGFCLILAGAGMWRHRQFQSRAAEDPLVRLASQEKTLTLTGIVIREPDIAPKSAKLTVAVENTGRILLTSPRYPEYEYGDKLKVEGRLTLPQVFPDFDYRGYLAKEGIYALMRYPRIEVLAENQGNVFYAKLLQFKNQLRQVFDQNLGPPQSGLLAAIILGDEGSLSDEWKTKLNLSGVRHITSVSGMHIVILSGILMWLILALGFWRGQAFYLTIILLALFIVMIGAPASAVRAGIMGGLLLLSQKIGRLNASARSLVLAAALMLAQNPLLLKADAGFQLSFLATLGIIYLLPTFQGWLEKLARSKSLSGLLAMTLAAQVFTLPLLIYNFGYVSLVSPLTNLFIVPVLSYIMAAAFIFGLGGMLWSGLGWVLSWPAWVLLSYLMKIVDWFSKIPAAFLPWSISGFWLLSAYLFLAGFAWWVKKRERLKFLSY